MFYHMLVYRLKSHSCSLQKTENKEKHKENVKEQPCPLPSTEVSFTFTHSFQ